MDDEQSLREKHREIVSTNIYNRIINRDYHKGDSLDEGALIEFLTDLIVDGNILHNKLSIKREYLKR